MTSRARTLTYKVWHAMHSRCTDPACESYENYGARGISVCARWDSFQQFVEDMGLQPQGLCIDRIDNNGNYEPANCRWVTRAESNRNRRPTKLFTMDGRTACMTDWAKEYGLSVQVVSARLNRGWSFVEAVTMPVLRRRQLLQGRVTA